MKQPTNTVTIRIGNQTGEATQDRVQTQQPGTEQRAQIRPQPSNDKTKDAGDSKPDVISQDTTNSVSLLEQVRERKKALMQSNHNNDQAALVDPFPIDRNSTQNVNGSPYTTLPTSNLGRNRFGKYGQKQLLFSKNKKASTLAIVFGICIGVLLGIGAYYLFTTVSKPMIPSNVGVTQTDSNAQSAGNHSSNASNPAQSSKSDASSTTNSIASKGTELGPGGATGPGTTVYLYQIGLFSDSSSLNEQVQALKEKGIQSIQRGKQPYQLIAGASATKTGIDSMNKLLKQASVDFYMKPFIVPSIPSQIQGVADSSSQTLKDALQSEWDFVDSALTTGKADNLASVTQKVKDALQILPATYSQAAKDIQSSLEEIQGIVGTNPGQGQSFSLGKFYTEFAQGVYDLQS